jgi:hypothetical protein
LSHVATPCASRLQFSLRAVLGLMAALSVCFLIGTKVGPIEGCGVTVAMILAVVFVKLKGHREGWVLRPFVAIVAGVIIWMTCVDWCHFRTDCDVCRLHGYELQIRALSVPLYRKKYPDHWALFSEVASDLGHPCEHQLQRRYKIRAWGFVYANPNINGTCCLVVGEWYLDPQREKMRELGKQQPHLGKEFHDRVILQQDYVYCRDFVKRFRAEHDPTYEP